MKTLGGIAVLVLLASCVENIEPEETPEEPSAQEPRTIPKLQDVEVQGRHILGEHLDDLGDGPLHWHVDGAAAAASGAAVTVTVEGAGLHAVGATLNARGNDPRLVGLRFQGSFGGEVRIAGVGTGPLPRYRIAMRENPGDPWMNPCDDGGLSVALHGTYGRDRVHNDTPGKLTFACPEAASAKCVDWGYVPGSSSTAPLWDHHQACTRMANSDMCGDGLPGTREGTRIQFRDETRLTSVPEPPVSYAEPTVWPPPPKMFFFEGAWGPRGAVCLSRKRWAAVDIEPCEPERLRDPRIDPEAIECDDLTITQMRELGALIYNSSQFNDLRLHRWQYGEDMVSTVNGMFYDQGSGRSPLEAMPPAVGRHLALDGYVMRVLPENDIVGEDDITALNLYVSPLTGDRVVTTETTAPVHYQNQGWQGYVLEEPRPNGTAPLYLHRRNAGIGSGYVTSILPSIPEYEAVEVVGHAME
jgi:hypothetical protein